MPNVSDFGRYLKNYGSEITFNVAEIVAEVDDLGANYMRDLIRADSPTGTDWHTYKNEANGNEYGARIGNIVPGLDKYGVDQHSGLMYNSVATKPVRSTKSSITGRFGWVNDKRKYFIQQDTGDYRNGGVGMGLLNDGNTLREFGAVVFAEQQLLRLMKKEGFRIALGGGNRL